MIKIFEHFEVSEDDEGLYKCLAENIVGNDEFSWQVKINIPPEIVQTSPRTSIVLKNEDFALECSAEGKPEPILSWTRNGRPLIYGFNIISKYKYKKGSQPLINFVCQVITRY